MREPVRNTSVFPIGPCGPCGKTVLTYVALDASGGEARFCIHCDGGIGDDLRWVTAEELEADGYEIGYQPGERTEKAGGCGPGGCGTCASSQKKEALD